MSAAAAMPMAARRAAARRRRGGTGRRADRVHRDPDRDRHQQDQRDQGGPRSHQPRPEGSQGPGRERAEADQGRRDQGRGGGDQEEVRRRRREGRSQVARHTPALPGLGAERAAGPPRPGPSAFRLSLDRVPRPPPPRAHDATRSGEAATQPARVPWQRVAQTRESRDPGEIHQHVQPPQERLPRAHRFFEDQDDHSDPEPDRDSEEVVRAVPADEPAALGARGRGPPVGLQVGLPDLGLPRELVARVHRVFDRQLGVQVRPAGRTAPPAQALRELRPHAGCRPVRGARSALPALRQAERGPRRRLRHLRQHRRPQAEVRRRRVPGARDDVRRPAQGHDPPRGLEQGSRDRASRPSATSRSRRSTSATSR